MTIPRETERPVKRESKPIANPGLVLREEFDDWAVLFDPDTGDGFGMNPVGVFIWKLMDGLHTDTDIAEELRKAYDDVPGDADSHVREFIADLVNRGFVGYEVANS